ncbi:NUDIX domain-containing protein [Paenibacillus dakarensis]|uniref:NUDIX domain-containing protein n=1 Tax=Paenibacillus dakarensis TaxID=1527293 RepID=UPI0006D58B3D|nr:NUDIX domain-containing protein [Paenibacillus dakarensis]
MKKRKRAFTAIIHDGKIVMIHVVDKKRDFWTLPGGGVEEGESYEEAAVREAKEEVNLEIKIIRLLFKSESEHGIEYCYLSEPVHNPNIKLGSDPELELAAQTLVDAQWKEIINVRDDVQVSDVLKSLTKEEIKIYQIHLGESTNAKASLS